MSPKQIFRLSPRRRWLLFGTAAFFGLLPLILIISGILTNDSSVCSAGGIVACLMLPFFFLLLFWAHYPRLEVDAVGISIRGGIGMATVSVPWANIERFRLEPLSEGLVLREPLESKATLKLRNISGVSMRGAQMYNDEQQQLMRELRYIPFEAFAYWLDQGTLVDAIRQHAPELAAKLPEQRAAAKSVAPSQKKVYFFIFGLSAVVILTAVLLGLYYPEFSVETQQKLSTAEKVFTAVIMSLVGTAMGIYSVVNLIASRRFIGDRQYGWAALWFLTAIVQICIVLSVVAAIL